MYIWGVWIVGDIEMVKQKRAKTQNELEDLKKKILYRFYISDLKSSIVLAIFLFGDKYNFHKIEYAQ